METLLAKFRIDFEEVIILTDIAKKADTSTAMEFDELVEGMNVSDEELHLEREKTNRYKLKNFRYILMNYCHCYKFDYYSHISQIGISD